MRGSHKYLFMKQESGNALGYRLSVHEEIGIGIELCSRYIFNYYF